MAARSLPRPLVLLLCLALLPALWLPPPAGAAPCAPPDPVADQAASRILAGERPFAIDEPDRFFTFERTEWKDTLPLRLPAGPALDEDATAAALLAFLERRFPCDPAQVQAGLAVYGDPIARQKIPEPTLRAALAALTGTVGEPAIEFLLYRTAVRLVAFGTYVDPVTGLPRRVAAASVSPDGTRYITIDRRYRFLPFGAFSALLAHEALHTGNDTDNAGLPEEIAASGVEALVYMEMLLTDPSLALLPDDLTRGSSNHLAAVRINSAPAGSDRLTLFVPGGTTSIDPLATAPLTEFADFYPRFSAPADDADWETRETEGNWLLWQVLERLAEPGAAPPGEGARFDAETLAFLDANQAALAPAEVLAVACSLGLAVPCP